MKWNCFIDDERVPRDAYWANWHKSFLDGSIEFVIARTFEEFQEQVEKHGTLPSYISFDHDLGDFQTNGYEISRHIADWIMDRKYALPADFGYEVHSQNPVGKVNIQRFLENFIYHWQKDQIKENQNAPST